MSCCDSSHPVNWSTSLTSSTLSGFFTKGRAAALFFIFAPRRVPPVLFQLQKQLSMHATVIACHLLCAKVSCYDFFLCGQATKTAFLSAAHAHSMLGYAVQTTRR